MPSIEITPEQAAQLARGENITIVPKHGPRLTEISKLFPVGTQVRSRASSLCGVVVDAEDYEGAIYTDGGAFLSVHGDVMLLVQWEDRVTPAPPTIEIVPAITRKLAVDRHTGKIYEVEFEDDTPTRWRPRRVRPRPATLEEWRTHGMTAFERPKYSLVALDKGAWSK